MINDDQNAVVTQVPACRPHHHGHLHINNNGACRHALCVATVTVVLLASFSLIASPSIRKVATAGGKSTALPIKKWGEESKESEDALRQAGEHKPRRSPKLVNCNVFRLEGKTSSTRDYLVVNVKDKREGPRDHYEDCAVRLEGPTYDNLPAKTTPSVLRGFQLVCGARVGCSQQDDRDMRPPDSLTEDVGVYTNYYRCDDSRRERSSEGPLIYEQHQGFMFAPVLASTSPNAAAVRATMPTYPLIAHNPFRSPPLMLADTEPLPKTSTSNITAPHAGDVAAASTNHNPLVHPDIFKCGVTTSVRTLCFNFSLFFAIDTTVCATRLAGSAGERNTSVSAATAARLEANFRPNGYFDDVLRTDGGAAAWQRRATYGRGIRVLGTAFIDSEAPEGINNHVVKSTTRGKSAKSRRGLSLVVNDEINDRKTYVLRGGSAPPPLPSQRQGRCTARDMPSPSLEHGPSLVTVDSIHLVYFHRKFYELNLGHTLMRVLALHAEAFKLQREYLTAVRRYADATTTKTPMTSTSNRDIQDDNNSSFSSTPNPSTPIPALHIALVAVLKEGGSSLGSFFLPLLSAGLDYERGAREVVVLPDDGDRLGIRSASQRSSPAPSSQFEQDEEEDPSVVVPNWAATNHPGPVGDANCGPIVVSAAESVTPTFAIGPVWPYTVNDNLSRNASSVALQVIHDLNEVLRRSMGAGVSDTAQLASEADCNLVIPSDAAQRRKRRRFAVNGYGEDSLVCLENAVIGYAPVRFSRGYTSTYVGEATADDSTKVPPTAPSTTNGCFSPQPTPPFQPPPAVGANSPSSLPSANDTSASKPSSYEPSGGSLSPGYLVDGIRAFRDALVQNWGLDTRAQRRHQETISQLTLLYASPSSPSGNEGGDGSSASGSWAKRSTATSTLRNVSTRPSIHLITTRTLAHGSSPPPVSSTIKIVIANRKSTRRMLNARALQRALLDLFAKAPKQGGSSRRFEPISIFSSDEHSPSAMAASRTSSRASDDEEGYPLSSLPALGGTSTSYSITKRPKIHKGEEGTTPQHSSQPSASSFPSNCTNAALSRRSAVQRQLEADRQDMLFKLFGNGDPNVDSLPLQQQRTPKLTQRRFDSVSIEEVYMEYLKSRPTKWKNPQRNNTASSGGGQRTKTAVSGPSLAEQAAVFFGADVVIAVHGAAVAWSVAMRDGGTLIEVIPPWWGGPIVPVDTSMYGAITYSNNIHHHTVSCGGVHSLSSLNGHQGRGVGGYNGAISANFNLPFPEMSQVLALTVTAIRRIQNSRP